MKTKGLLRAGVAVAAVAAGVAVAAPAAYAANQTPCAGRTDLVAITDHTHTVCYANAGNVDVYMYGVTNICTGNNSVYVRKDAPNWALPRNYCTPTDRINVYTINITKV